MSTVRTYLKAIAQVRNPSENTIVSTGFAVVRPRSMASDFLSYLMTSEYAMSVVVARSVGVSYPAINAGDLATITFPAPPTIDQHAICSFLDRETLKIDELVAEQERLVALLKEKRQVVISHAVTRGLDPNAPMKDSGVEWLGEVPAHWDVSPLGRVTTSKCDGPFGSGLKSEHYADTGVRVVRLQNIRERIFDDEDAAYISVSRFANELGGGHGVCAGDVLIAGLGDDRNKVGRACVAPNNLEQAMVKADCFRFRLNSLRASSQFVATQLSIGAAYDAGVLSTGSTRSRIPLSVMATRRLAIPSLAEQHAIEQFIDDIAARSSETIFDAELAIVLLQERRSALISAAVTGKIDVRGLVADKVEAA